MHLLSPEKISFSMEICCKCLKHSIVFQWTFFEATHVSANTLQLKFLDMRFFLIHPGN